MTGHWQLATDHCFLSPFNRVKECYCIVSVADRLHSLGFQSPFNRVKECYEGYGVDTLFFPSETFSPLLIGSRNVTRYNRGANNPPFFLSVPF